MSTLKKFLLLSAICLWGYSKYIIYQMIAHPLPKAYHYIDEVWFFATLAMAMILAGFCYVIDKPTTYTPQLR